MIVQTPIIFLLQISFYYKISNLIECYMPFVCEIYLQFQSKNCF